MRQIHVICEMEASADAAARLANLRITDARSLCNDENTNIPTQAAKTLLYMVSTVLTRPLSK